MNSTNYCDAALYLRRDFPRELTIGMSVDLSDSSEILRVGVDFVVCREGDNFNKRLARNSSIGRSRSLKSFEIKKEILQKYVGTLAAIKEISSIFLINIRRSGLSDFSGRSGVEMLRRIFSDSINAFHAQE